MEALDPDLTIMTVKGTAPVGYFIADDPAELAIFMTMTGAWNQTEAVRIAEQSFAACANVLAAYTHAMPKNVELQLIDANQDRENQSGDIRFAYTLYEDPEPDCQRLILLQFMEELATIPEVSVINAGNAENGLHPEQPAEDFLPLIILPQRRIASLAPRPLDHLFKLKPGS